MAGILTYGQPRCGDSDFQRLFAEAFAGRAAHYVQPLDILPRLPLSPAYAPCCNERIAMWLAVPHPLAAHWALPSTAYPQGIPAARATRHLARSLLGDVLPGPPQWLLHAGLAVASGLIAHLPCVYESALRDGLCAFSAKGAHAQGSLHLLANAASARLPTAGSHADEGVDRPPVAEASVTVLADSSNSGQQPLAAQVQQEPLLTDKELGSKEVWLQSLAKPLNTGLTARTAIDSHATPQGTPVALGGSGWVSPVGLSEAGLEFEDAVVRVETSANSFNSSEHELTLMAV